MKYKEKDFFKRKHVLTPPSLIRNLKKLDKKRIIKLSSYPLPKRKASSIL
jgi:hypothetical protein